MDCMVNVAIDVPASPGVRASTFICEVQVVHRQMLTVRKDMGAHSSYTTFRAATELLHCTGNQDLLSADGTKRWILNEVAKAFVLETDDTAADATNRGGVSGGKGALLSPTHTEPLVIRAEWSLCNMPHAIWPYPLLLDLGHRTVTGLRKVDGVASKVLSHVQSTACLGSAFKRVREGLQRLYGVANVRCDCYVLATPGCKHVLTVCYAGSVSGKEGEDLSLCASASTDGSIRVWACESGALLKTVQCVPAPANPALPRSPPLERPT